MKRPIPFGKYFLLERINVGGMAEVFKAKTYGVEGFERLLAVKRILPNIAEDEEFITMFIDEAKIAVELNHGNIAQIFDLGKVDGSFFIALEYVPGKDLRAIFDRCRALSETMPIAQACFMTMKVCEGLDYAHNKRDKSGREMHLVHRDVSPQNVLISYEGEVKLVDFGIAKAAGKASKTQAGILKGKFGYMSPEQVRGLPLDRRSDIFSVGIVLYELLTGERLFTGESDFSTLEKVRNVEILPPSTYNRKIAEQLEQIVLKALAKDVEDRYQNAIDLHDDLQAYMYTSGEFFSRKDLAAWMKKTFAREIEEEAKKLEEYRQLPAPDLRSAPPPLPSALGDGTAPGNGGNGHPVTPFSGISMATPTADIIGDTAVEGRRPQSSAPDLTWDEDEVETQIYDKPSAPLDMPTAHPPGAAEDHGDGTAPPLTGSSGHAALNTRNKPTLQVPAMPLAHPRPAQEKRKSRPLLWTVLVLFFIGACGAAVYLYLQFLKKPGHITVIAIPSDVKVFLEGIPQSGNGTPLTIRSLKPGHYSVAVTKPGYERWNEIIEVKPGATVSVTPQLEALATASIELRSTPQEGDVFLDGRKLNGKTNMRITQVTPGKHRLEVHKLPFQPWVEEFEIKPEQKLRLYAKLLPKEVVVQIKSDPRAEAFLVRDNQSESVGMTPVTLKLNPKFSYKVEVKREGFSSWSRAIEFEGERPVRLEAILERGSVAKEPSPPPASTVVPPVPTSSSPVAKKPPTEPKTSPKKVSQRITPPPVEPKAKPKERKSRPKEKKEKKDEPLRTVPAQQPQPTDMGTLLINTNPWTQIIIDGRDTGLTTPQKRIPLPAGKHKLTLRNSKFNIDESVQILIKPGQPTKVIKAFQVNQ